MTPDTNNEVSPEDGAMPSRHTPGPWTVRTLENFGFNVVHYIGGDKFDIARVAKCGNEADARLIAAAPELLEALEYARGILAHSGAESGYCMCGDPVESHSFGSGHAPVDSHSYTASQAVERFDALIARARGEPRS